MRSLLGILFGLFLVVLPTPSFAYDIKKDYCGAVIDYRMCKCAFHNEMCSDIKSSKSVMKRVVNDGYALWVCGKQGKVWSFGKCVKPGKEKVQCSEPLYEEDDGACVWRGSRGISWSAESSEDFRETVEALELAQGTVFAGKDVRGNEIRVGIMRLADGSWVFTSDGEHYFSTPGDAIRPGVFSRISTSIGDFRRWLARGVGIGKYAGRDTADDPDAQRTGQRILDAATPALDGMIKMLKQDDEESFDGARETIESWSGRLEKVLGEEYESLVVDELGELSGLDTKTVKRILDGDDWEKIKEGKIEDWTDDMLDTAKKALYAFPAESVKILFHELRRDRFADAVRSYGIERDAGKSAELIFAQTLKGELPEIEVANLSGPTAFVSYAAVFSAYEEAYQRLQVREMLGK